jgi:hypothetical protein
VYENMWVYGNHYHVDMELRPLMHLKHDYGVACIFRLMSCNSTKDYNMVMANLNYVGVLKEMLVLDCFGLLLVLFKCSWIPANTQGNATICQDEYGFWVVNFVHNLLPMVELYVFPIVVSQNKGTMGNLRLNDNVAIHFGISLAMGCACLIT